MLAGAIGAAILLFVLQPLALAYQPTGDQVRDFFGGVWNWLNGPEIGLWLLVAVCGLILYRALRNRHRTRSLGLAWCMFLGISAGVGYRVEYGYPTGVRPYADPATWLVGAGFVLWILLGITVPAAYRRIVSVLDARRFDRDWRWILQEREVAHIDREARPQIRQCNVDKHRPMQGLEICTHELRLAASRSNRARRKMEGEFPQKFKHQGSPGYDPSVKRATRDPVLSKEQLAELQARRDRLDGLDWLRSLIATKPKRLKSESAASIDGQDATYEPRRADPADDI